MNEENKIPTLICNGKDLTNWQEIERYLIWNCPVYFKARHEALRSQLDETGMLKIAVYFLAQQNQSLMQLEIDRASNSCAPVMIPVNQAPKISRWKKFFYFIRTGDFGIWKS